MLSRILGAIGRTLITAGTLILLFVAYQLWGTGLQEARSQNQLEDQFATILAEQQAAADTTTTTTTTTTTAPEDPDRIGLQQVDPVAADLPLPAEGDPVATISIPAINVTRTVVEGIPLSQLKRGPGHYPETPLPGQRGNVAIAGHRTTYGQPFHNVDKLENGDQILFETIQGEFVYEVTEIFVVQPDQVEILEDFGDNRVTLIACEPKYSAAKRIIIVGELAGEPAPPIAGQEEARADAADASGELVGDEIDGGLSGESAARTPTILWGLAAAGVWLVTWLAQVALRRRVRDRAEADGTAPSRGQRLLTWSPYLVGLPVFLVVLYVFFENFGRLLPGNY
ncbi:MAG: class E sortase [Acidimicrobiales bacterium]|nr:class E sortase [Acidimicrobiales bacterium]